MEDSSEQTVSGLQDDLLKEVSTDSGDEIVDIKGVSEDDWSDSDFDEYLQVHGGLTEQTFEELKSVLPSYEELDKVELLKYARIYIECLTNDINLEIVQRQRNSDVVQFVKEHQQFKVTSQEQKEHVTAPVGDTYMLF